MVAVLFLAAGTLSHGGNEPCPVHAQDGASVDSRHEQVTGIPKEVAEHHFALSRDGGSIRLGTRADGPAREQIRAHLKAIAKAFAAGDFSMPRRIHDVLPPGAAIMRERKDVITYVYAPEPEGGVVKITTTDAEARAAIHAFLRFQIRDHGTGDPDAEP